MALGLGQKKQLTSQAPEAQGLTTSCGVSRRLWCAQEILRSHTSRTDKASVCSDSAQETAPSIHVPLFVAVTSPLRVCFWRSPPHRTPAPPVGTTVPGINCSSKSTKLGTWGRPCPHGSIKDLQAAVYRPGLSPACQHLSHPRPYRKG